MSAYTIRRKMSGTGNYHDIASDLCDRHIHFGPGCKYAVVLAAYYGGKGYTSHKTESAAIRAAHRLGDYSYQIIDTEGNVYAIQPEPDYHEDSLYRI